MSENRAEATAPALPVRVVSVFTSPGALFEKLAARPVWLDVLLLTIAINLAVTFLLPEEFVRSAVEVQLGADATAEQVDAAMRLSQTLGPIFAVVTSPIVYLVVAGVLLMAYNVVLGGEATYRQLFSAAVHAGLILTAGGLVTIALSLASGGQAIVLSPGLLIPGLGDGYAARFVERINVFAVWNCFVLGIAVSRIYPKRGAGGATVYLLVLYLALVGLFAIPGGAGS